MRNKIIFFAFILVMALALPVFAQFTPVTIPKPVIKQQEKENMMGKPTFQATSGDLIFSIWITKQEDHKKMMMEMKENGSGMDMKGMKDMSMKKDSGSMMGKGMEMDNATKEAMMAGTHHMMVEVKNSINGKETNAISAKVEIVSPSNKNSSVDLKMPVTDHFGSGITLDEMGEYQLTVSVTVGDVAKTMKLKYTAR